ncbi:transposase [Streptomyces sp. SBC-4]|nr:transposase [Streptomyces sp. SBC-4]MDV5143655.1 transposase [Streptomyces sp. SBC-4]
MLETVFCQVAGPLATPATPGAWWRGLRLLALDGTQFDLPDSTSNGDTFDGPSTTGDLGTTLLDPEQYPAAALVALYRERCEIELAFDEIKNHLGPGGPIGSRTPEGVRQELWAYLAVHHAIRQFAHTAALARPPKWTPTVSPT